MRSDLSTYTTLSDEELIRYAQTGGRVSIYRTDVAL